MRGMKHGVYLSILFILASIIMPAGSAHAWGVYSGMHGGSLVQGSVTMSNTGLNIPGLTVARELVDGNLQQWPSDTYAYAKFISGYEMDGSISPWGNEYLTNALVYLNAYIEEGTYTGPLTIEAYHISDDGWIGSELTWANQPYLNGAIATLLATQTIDHVGPTGVPKITWDLLADGSPYLDIWKTQDLTDGAISIMFKISGTDLGKVILYQGNFSLTLEGNQGPSTVPEPASMLLLGLGFAALAGVRRTCHR